MTTMPSRVAWATAMLSRPMPYRPTERHRGAASRTLSVTGFQQVKIPSASGASSINSSSSPVSATINPASAFARISCSGRRSSHA